MNTEIKCPHCGQVFQVDETGYANILQQVRTAEFDQELSARIHQLQDSQKANYAALKAQQETALNEATAERDMEIARLKEQLSSKEAEYETAKKLAITEAVSSIAKERDDAQANLKLQKAQAEQERLVLQVKMQEKISTKDEIIKLKDDEIARVKELRATLSTKMIGESLERHCEAEFNKVRMMAFPNAYFEKDNDNVKNEDESKGTKADYIYREFAEDGTELLTICFEMKNEMDTTDEKQKHTNESFFSKLDKDRKKKNCEYAVLVSMLEQDSELYNQGIVDVSYRYPKMFVIRPQFFIALIGILRNAALDTLSYKKQLNVLKNQEVDVTNFENKLLDFQAKFGRNYRLASDKFNDAIDEIDNSIKACTCKARGRKPWRPHLYHYLRR